MTTLTLTALSQRYTVSMKRSTVYIALTIALLGLLCGYLYLQIVPAGCVDLCGEGHQAIIDHTANSPYRYRVLAAYFADLLAPYHTNAGVMVGYTLAHIIVFPLMLFSVYAWLRLWLDVPIAFIGLLMIVGLMPIMLRVWGTALFSAVEVVFLCVGLVLLYRQPRYWTLAFALVVLIASFNRETALLLPLAYATTQLARWREVGYWLRGLLFGSIWAVVFVGLRLTLGTGVDDVPIAEAWRLNTLGLWHTQEAVFKNLFFLPIWVLYIDQIRRAPAFLKRLVPVALVYLMLFLVFAFWNEVRLLLPLLVFTFPVALSVVKLPILEPTAA